VFVNGLLTSHYLNALDGHARGIELLLQRQATNGLPAGRRTRSGSRPTAIA
jgi:hypothetical protein